MLAQLLKVFEWLWAKREILPYNPDVIVPLDYAMGQDGHISIMSVAGLRKAAAYGAHFKNAVVAYANSAHCFSESDSSGVIAAEKQKLLLESQVPLQRVVDAGGIVNSVTEASAVRTALEKNGVVPKEILVITGRQHSRSALYIWRRMFPGVHIALVYFDGLEWQPNHVFPSQRSGWVWAKANILRQIVLRIPFFGLKIAAVVKHKQKGAR